MPLHTAGSAFTNDCFKQSECAAKLLCSTETNAFHQLDCFKFDYITPSNPIKEKRLIKYATCWLISALNSMQMKCWNLKAEIKMGMVSQ